jgi:ribosomal protein S18 acetylase RimI-like enzyme
MALIAKPENLVFIAEVEGVAAGYVYGEVVRQPETSFRHGYEMVYLHHISVRPAYRRRGVRQALVDAAGELGIGLMALDVWSFNEEARAFFRRQGFAVFNERMWNR